MACGRLSLRDVDKVKELKLELVQSTYISVPGLLRAIANIELAKRATLLTGDHILVVGEVLKFGVNKANRERPLVSLGPRVDGFDVLAHEGMHRLGVVRTSRR